MFQIYTVIIMPFNVTCTQCPKFGPPHPCKAHADCSVDNPTNLKGSKLYDPNLCSICSEWLNLSKQGDQLAIAHLRKLVQRLRTTISKSKPKNSLPTEFIAIFFNKEEGLQILKLLSMSSGVPSRSTTVSRDNSLESNRQGHSSGHTLKKGKQLASPRALVKPVQRDRTPTASALPSPTSDLQRSDTQEPPSGALGKTIMLDQKYFL